MKKIVLETLKSLVKKFVRSKGFVKDLFFSPGTFKTFCRNSRMFTEKSVPFSDTCLKFTAIFCELLQTKKLRKSCGTVVEVHLLGT